MYQTCTGKIVIGRSLDAIKKYNTVRWNTNLVSHLYCIFFHFYLFLSQSNLRNSKASIRIFFVAFCSVAKTFASGNKTYFNSNYLPHIHRCILLPLKVDFRILRRPPRVQVYLYKSKFTSVSSNFYRQCFCNSKCTYATSTRCEKSIILYCLLLTVIVVQDDAGRSSGSLPFDHGLIHGS